MVFPATGAVYPISAMGTFQTDPLISTDNVDLEPQGWAYVVKVELQDLQAYTFTTLLPSSPSTVDLSALEPVFPAGTVLGPPGTYLPSGGGTETGTLVLDGDPPVKIPGSPDGYILISDGAGNFTVQANPGGSGGSADSINGVTVSGTVAVGRTIIVTGTGPATATWQLPLQLDFTNSDVAPLAATALASSSAGLSGPPGITQAAGSRPRPPDDRAGGVRGVRWRGPGEYVPQSAGHGHAPRVAAGGGPGGTGSGTQNFADLSTTQTVGGAKTFTGAPTSPGPW